MTLLHHERSMLRMCVFPQRVHPPDLAHHERQVNLDLVETRTFSSGVVYLRYRVAR